MQITNAIFKIVQNCMLSTTFIRNFRGLASC